MNRSILPLSFAVMLLAACGSRDDEQQTQPTQPQGSVQTSPSSSPATEPAQGGTVTTTPTEQPQAVQPTEAQPAETQRE